MVIETKEFFDGINRMYKIFYYYYVFLIIQFILYILSNKNIS